MLPVVKNVKKEKEKVQFLLNAVESRFTDNIII